MNREEAPHLWRTGAFLMASIALLLGAVVLLGRSQTLFAHRVHLHTSFENTSGLVVGTPVRLGGVDVGVVESIRFDNDLREKKVHVGLAVERRYLDRIRADSLARLSSKGLLGDMLIDITVGSLEAAPLADGATLRSHESEGLTEIIASVQDGIDQLRSLSASVQERLEVVLTDELGRDLGRIAHAAAGVAEHVEHGDGLAHALVYEPRLARNADRMLAEGRQLAISANDAIGRADRLLAAIEQGDGTLHGLVYRDDGGRLLAELGRTARALDDVVAQVRSGKGLLHGLVYEPDRGELLANLTAMSKTLRRIADETDAGKGTVGALLKDPSVYEDLKTILGNIKRNRLLKAVIRYTIKKDGLQS
ncbi:MAG: MlaD family protein, partial [Polyangia bacterium]